MAESASVVRELSDRHLQSVVSLQVQWKDPSQEGRQEIICSATGSIIQASLDFLFILTCSHTFKPFCVFQGPDLDSVETINKNTNLQVDFYDAHVESGQVHAIDWLQDMCLIVIPFPLKSTYEPIRFIDDEEDMMGQSVYAREAKVYSIYCFPTSHKANKCLFGTTTKGEICGRNDLVGNDLDRVYRPDLKIFEFDVAGAAQWAHTWFNITRSRTMNEIVAKASACMSVKLAEIALGVDVSSLEMEIDEVDLSSLEIVDGLDL